MRRVTSWALIAGVAVVAVLGICLWLVESRARRTFPAPYPAIKATSDAASVELGRYLVYGPAACAYCHVPRERWKDLASGSQLPLSGNHVFRLPFGELFSSNLTSDAETGVGRRTDGELARILRVNAGPKSDSSAG